MSFLLRHINGTYYRRFIRGFGPEFGVTEKDAERFESLDDAIKETGKHWAFVDVIIIKNDGDKK